MLLSSWPRSTSREPPCDPMASRHAGGGAMLTEGSCPHSVMEWGAETGHKAQCELHPSFPWKMLKELRGRGGHVSWGIRGGLREEVETILREKEAREDIPERENGGQSLT